MAKPEKRSSMTSDTFVDENSQSIEQFQALVDRYKRIFSASGDYGFFEWDSATNILHWNGEFWASLGYDDDDMERISSPNHFLEYVHSDDRAKVLDSVAGVLKNETDGNITFRVFKRNGDYIWCEIRVVSTRQDNNWVRYSSGIIVDVTKSKKTEQALLESEARHSRIIRGSSDGIWEWSAADDSFEFSERCWEMIGYTDRKEAINEGLMYIGGWRDRMHKGDLRRYNEELKKHLKGGSSKPLDIEYRIRGKDNKWYWLRSRAQTTYAKDGSPICMSGSNMDITALKRAERRVIKAKEDAEKANRAKSEFLSGMSHELRTPLNAILGFAQLLDLDENLTETQKDNLGEIKNAGNHLLKLVGDVLDLAKIEAGRMEFELQNVSPVNLIRDCIALVKAQALAYGINLNLEAKSLENRQVIADEVRLKQVLLNLISNAVKYNRRDGTVTIKCCMFLPNRYRVAVSDTGVGIPKSKQCKLFQPFSRLGAERSNIEGSGMGLVVTKELVEAMGGSIGMQTEVGKGSTFWVEFPLVKEEVHTKSILLNQTSTIEEKINTKPDQLLVSDKKKILYVEDNPPNQRVMQQFLQKFSNLELEIVDHAMEGIYFARSEKPDLVILDINLPGMNGYEVVEVLKKDPVTQHIPVIALSANALAHDIEKGKEAGFDNFLTKPVSLAQIVTVFNELLV